MEVEKGYRALPVPLADGPCPCRRFVYIREHRDKQGGGGQGRTLFVANVDDQGGAWSETEIEDILRKQWSAVGAVEAVELGDRDGGTGRGDINSLHNYPSRFARIRFASADSVHKALELNALPHVPRPNGGVKRMLREHATQLRDAVSLGREADAYMEEFDREAEEEIRERQRKANEPDEDGFVTVSYKKRRGGGSSLGGGAIIPEGRTSKRPRKKKEMELTNFYRFQVREAKRDQLAKLREKFEADKEKVQRMKEARQFKPF